MRGELDRSSFIAAIKAELEQQQQSSKGLNNIPDISASEVARKLHFDYPLVSSNDINVLVDALEKLKNTGERRINHYINFGKRLLDNVEYLTQCRQATEDRGFAQAMSKLTSSIYLSSPWRLLSMNKRMLTSLLKSDVNRGIEETVFTSSDSLSDTPLSMDALSWSEIFDNFATFSCNGNASYICTAASNDDGWCADNLQKDGRMKDLCSMLSFLGDLMTLTLNKSSESDCNDQNIFYGSGSTTASDDMSLRAILELRAKQVSWHDSDSPASIRDQTFVSTIQKVWLHLAYLARDLLSQCPQLLEGNLRGILLAISHLSHRGKDTSYPTSCECMQALVCSNLAMAICSPSTAETRTVKSLSREALRVCLSAGVGDISLTSLVDIFQRMGRQSVDGGEEACSLLLDVCTLFLDGYDKRGVGIKLPMQLKTMHDHLLTSRAIVTLVEFLEAFTKPSATDSDSDEDLKRPQQLSQVVGRLVQFLGKACLQSTDMLGAFILRLPAFGPCVSLMMKAWSESRGKEVVSPVLALPLLLALVMTTKKEGNESLPNFSGAFTLSIDMTAIRIEQSSMPKEQKSEHGSVMIDDSAKSDLSEADAELVASEKAKACQVPGLEASLDALVAHETGGYQVLTRARNTPELKNGLSKICNAIIESGTKNMEIRRLSKDLKALLEGIVKKTD